jgi:RNA polymerase sigma factor (TIGR02999 family)
MRRILVDNARRKKSLKRGQGGERVSLDRAPELSTPATAIDDLLALDEALRKLEHLDPLKARIVQLRYFAGLSIDQTAQALDLSPATVKRHWVYARSWLYGQLHDG